MTCPCWCQSLHFYFFCLSCWSLCMFLFSIVTCDYYKTVTWAASLIRCGFSDSPLPCLFTVFALSYFIYGTVTNNMTGWISIVSDKTRLAINQLSRRFTSDIHTHNAKSKKVFYPGIYHWGIYLFTNRVITRFGSNFLKISCDFADFGVGRT